MYRALHTILLIFYSWMTVAGVTPSQEIKISGQNYILILCAYQYENPYATAITKKIQHNLEQANPELIFRTVYGSLDIQQTMLASRLNMQKAFGQGRLTSKVFIPRVLVLVGDESWMLYRIMNLRGKWEKVPVVLCGVNAQIQKDYSNFFSRGSFADSLMIPLSQSVKNLQVTGILKDNVSLNVVTFMHKIFPALREIVYISRGDYSDEYAWQEQQQAFVNNLPRVKRSYFNQRLVSSDSIIQYINNLSSDSAAILFNTRPSFLPSLKLPAFALRDGGTENDDVIGGYYTLSNQFAQQTSQLVMRIFNGTSLKELPFQYVQNHHFYLNAQAPHLPNSNWQKRDLPGLIYYNVPPPFYIRHLRLIIAILLLASVSVTILMIYRKSKKYRQHIQNLLNKYKGLHEKFQTIYDHMPIALLIFNEQGQLLYKNPFVRKLERLWFADTFDHLNLFQDIFTNTLLQEKIHNRENINRILPVCNGKLQSRPAEMYQEDYYYFRLIVRYIPAENYNAENILVMLMDNSEIYREKIAHKRLRSVFNFAMNQAHIGVAEYNLCTRTGIATDWWRKNLNLQSRLLRNDMSSYKHVIEEDQEAIRHFFKEAHYGKGKFFSKEIGVFHSDGSLHHLREQIKVMEYQPANNQIWLAELSQNIDEEKKYAAEIQTAIDKAQKAERLKNTFIANMSHEIRTPLNAIVGFSNLISSTPDLEARAEMIHHIEENNEILLRLVNDIIDLSKIETGTMTFTFSTTDLNALFEDIRTIFQIRAKQKNLSLTCICPLEELYLLMDKIRIRQVISNFVSNAIKFTVKGNIQLGYELEKDKLYVYVKDSGIGIPEDHLSKVFKRFYRANKIQQGYGLGLSIAQAIIEGLNGEIGVDSQKDKGSKFWFRIPVEVVNHSSSSLHAQSHPSMVSHLTTKQFPHLLIVEDDESNYLLMHFMLRDDFRITHARNGEEAVELYKKEQPDLILMDIKIPKKNGYQATEEIRALSSQVPIIATTAYAFSKDEAQALNNGFNAYLAKPLKKQLLLDTISYWLNYAN